MGGKALRIGLDARTALFRRTGVERYAEEVARSMAEAAPERDLVFYSDRPLDDEAAETLPGSLRLLPQSGLPARAPFDLWMARILGPELLKDRIDCFFSTSSKFPLNGPVPVTTVHGMEWWRQPEAYSRSQRIRQRLWMHLTLRRAARIVCFADSTVRDIAAFAGRSVPTVRVASEAAAAHFRRLDTPPEDPVLGSRPYFFVLGTLEPRKNVDGILRAYASAARDRPDFPDLAIAGQAALRSDRLCGLVGAEGIADRVHFLGYVDEDRLVALLNRATALLFLSQYEGFGLPILEAMQCGTPVLTSNISSMPEVAGDAALLADPRDIGEMAEAMIRIVTEPGLADTLSQRGRQRAQGYSWKRAAEEVLGVLDEAVSDART